MEILTRRPASDKILFDKAFKIAENPKYDWCQWGLASMVYKFFDKKTSGIENYNISNEELAEDLHKPIITKLNKRKVHSPFIDNIWGTGRLFDMKFISEFNKEIRFLCVVDIFSKYWWVIHLEDKKGITITNAFQKI